MWPVFRKKKKKRRFQPTLVTNIHHQKCMHSVWFPFFSLSFSFLSFLSLSISFLPFLSLFLFLSLPFFFLMENLLLWQSATHSESLTKQSFQFLVSNKLIFVHAALLRKEGQFYAGFYGLQHKGIYLHASYLAGTQQTMRSSILAIASCNEEL